MSANANGAAPCSSPETQRPRRRGGSWTIVLAALFLPLLSSFLTDSYTFTLGPACWGQLRKHLETSSANPFRRPPVTLTPDELAQYDGRDGVPVYVAVGGEVYDVSKNRRVYGKGGSYNMMAGRDASRSFVTGCFKTHLTHDLRGLSAQELEAVDRWKAFFTNHADYRRVGTVLNPPIDPGSPIPPPCREQGSDSRQLPRPNSSHGSRGPQDAPGRRAAAHGVPRPGPVHHGTI